MRRNDSTLTLRIPAELVTQLDAAAAAAAVSRAELVRRILSADAATVPATAAAAVRPPGPAAAAAPFPDPARI